MNHVGRRMGQILAEHAPGPEYAIVECVKCRTTARVDDSAGLSLEDLKKAFEDTGWSIRPTLCPNHALPKRD